MLRITGHCNCILVCILIQERKKMPKERKGDDKANVLKCLQPCTVLATLLSLKLFQNRKLTQETHERFPSGANSSVPLACLLTSLCGCLCCPAARGSSCYTSLPSRLRATLLSVESQIPDSRSEVLRSQLFHPNGQVLEVLGGCYSPSRRSYWQPCYLPH